MEQRARVRVEKLAGGSALSDRRLDQSSAGTVVVENEPLRTSAVAVVEDEPLKTMAVAVVVLEDVAQRKRTVVAVQCVDPRSMALVDADEGETHSGVGAEASS